MTVWCHLPTIFNRRYALRVAGLIALCVALTTTLFFNATTYAVTGTNSTLSFQGRLQYATGGAVADGHYNIQFKIYQDGAGTSAGDPGGTLKWTESYVNNGGTGGVDVKNGYMSVALGSVNSFGNSIDWNQDTLWLSMNIAGSATGCTTFNSSPCVADGEMLPMQRMTAVPQALNSNAVGGKTADNLVQLAQGVQTDASTNTSSIFINKTGSGNLLQLQNTGIDIFTINNTGDLAFGSNNNHNLSIATSTANNAGGSLTVAAGSGGSGTGNLGGNLSIQGGAGGGTNGGGGNVSIDAGAVTGSGGRGIISIGSANAGAITIGAGNLSSGTQTITIGGQSVAGGAQNVTVGSASGASAGTTTIQAKNTVTIATDGVTKATFDNTTNSVYFGNGLTAAAPNDFAINGTGSSTTGVAGGALTVQGGNATVGNANGGNVTISGGTGAGSGANGLVVLSTPAFSTTTNDANCYTGGANVAATCTIAAASVNNSSAILVGFSNSGQTANLPDPTITTAGRVIYVTAANGSSDFTLSINGGGTGNLTSMRQNTTATMIWNGSDWTVAGASNSTTLQSAYDNTLQSAGGAELIVSGGTNANGLTIRDSSTNPVNGTLLEVQNASAATLFSVNSNIPEYATDGGAEVAGASASALPTTSWGAAGTGSTIARYTTAGNYIATGLASVKVTSNSADSGAFNKLGTALTPGMTYNVSVSVRLDSASNAMNDFVIYYLADGNFPSNTCISNVTVQVSTWKKINCSFTAPASGEVPGNLIAIGQSTASGAHTYYLDNLSVSIATSSNYATDGSVRDSTNFSTNWTTSGSGSTVTRNTSDGYDASDSAQATVTSGANVGLRNKLSINPLPGSLYRVSTYAKLNSGTAFSDFKIRYSRDGGTSFVDCVDYSTQTVTTTGWTQITCFVTADATAATSPYIYFVQAGSATRTFSVDTFSMTLYSNTTSNVQIGGGANGGPTTLLTLDKGASAPIAANNDALLGSMYYDTTIGKLQCYEADGWGSCGSSPDNIVTISPEYNNAVMHGTGVGTMTSDLCSSTLNINNGTSGQPTICGTNETYNFYKWTSPQVTAQAYGIYVTYQLPNTFKEFTSGSTSLMGRTDSSNSSVSYQIYKSNSSGLTSCGGSVTVSTGSQSTWQTAKASGGADPSTCGFTAGDSIVFKISTTAASNANAYVGNLGFTYSNR
ncbi:MAG: exported protein of unknown function [Candidatus Saccharibacteria bacterium]|nr:exported protein of unknown function [Candidatus Saccharibacteria bacterium]